MLISGQQSTHCAGSGIASPVTSARHNMNLHLRLLETSFLRLDSVGGYHKF